MSCAFTDWVWITLTPKQSKVLVKFLNKNDISLCISREGSKEDIYKGIYLSYWERIGKVVNAELWSEIPPHYNDNQMATWDELCIKLEEQFGECPGPKKINVFGVIGLFT